MRYRAPVEASMRVFSYVVAADSGFAPNPFHGVCTLACCKPTIRRTASAGDLVVGMSRRCERVVYAMRVARVLDFEGYWADAAAASKRPDRAAASARLRRGDNIYRPLGDGEFEQLPSGHSQQDGSRHEGHCRRDLGGRHVLVADDFCYFGGAGPPVPIELGFLKTGRGHRCHFTAEQLRLVERWFEEIPRGVLGAPGRWPPGDDSWREA
ncbi:MAG: hypothetical protein R3F29_03450 [Planctomycetota bacterium]